MLEKQKGCGKMKVLKPTGNLKIYDIAADVFSKLYFELCGKSAEIVTEDDGTDDLVVIGSDSVNNFVFNLILNKNINNISVAPGSDDYVIESIVLDGRKILLLCGGRGRSTLYAVYRYFEEYCGCRYFWDGDVIPKTNDIPLENIYLVQKQKFKYRGMRYFAHTGLHRFRAELWSFEDWKREIDWLVKKGLNLFMLRIGHDDLFQKAFPDIVPYPENDGYLLGDKDGYFDRTPPWSLKFKGELRKKVLDYAFERELMHPEDCGTMSHWYSPTPNEFIKKVQPKILGQFSESESSSSIWDIRDAKNVENYFKITKAHVDNYGKGELFHTIGYAEHDADNDPEKNLYLKLFMYKKTLEYKNQINENAPLMLATWDFWNNLSSSEVEKILSEFDPQDIIALDYTSDTASENNFTNWGVIGKVPYTFGMFHGFSSNTDIREDYERTEERLKIAADDEFCCGMVYWPELSHGDTFSIEYFTDNTRTPLGMSLEDRTLKFCRDRYGEKADKMADIWNELHKFTKLFPWSTQKQNIGNTHYVEQQLDTYYWLKNSRICGEKHCFAGFDIDAAMSLKENMVVLLENLATVDYENNVFLKRDMYDIARTVMMRFIAIMMYKTVRMLNDGDYKDADDLVKYKDSTIELFNCLSELLSSNDEYSLYKTYTDLFEVNEVNPVFEHTLKKNVTCEYNRTHVAELVDSIYIPETLKFFDVIRKNIGNNIKTIEYLEELEQFRNENLKKFYDCPLCDMQKTSDCNFRKSVNSAINVLKGMPQ